MTKKMKPVHPGEILKEDFMVPLELSANKLARHIMVPPNRISRIVACEQNVTANTAVLLSAYFETTPDFWLNLQKKYELDTAMDSKDLQMQAKAIKPMQAA